MKKQLILSLTIYFFLNNLSAQNIKSIDSLTVEMCKSLSTITGISNKEKIESVFKNHLSNYFDKLQISSQVDADTINTRVYYRLQKNCAIFGKILAELEENKSDWKTLSEKPGSKLQALDYKSFSEGGSFYYKEYNGDIVNVLLSKNSWTETFKDGTKSNLLFLPKTNNEFELEFIESNNEMRKNFSVKGEIYRYGIYAKENDELFVWVISKEKQFLGFKLYKKQ
jgi:hypothetical protein